jgi:uncharacterized OB-fold protein
MSHRSSVPMKWRQSRKTYPKIHTGTGTIVSFTIIRNAPAGFGSCVPYAVAVINVGGENTTAQVVGPLEKITIGAEVRPVFRKMYEAGRSGVIEYATKFEVL